MKIIVIEIPETALRVNASDIVRVELAVHRSGEQLYTYQLPKVAVSVREFSTSYDISEQ